MRPAGSLPVEREEENMDKSKILAVSILGMNRLSKSDFDHPFDMDECFKKYSIEWMRQVKEIEKDHSTPFYELASAVDSIVKEHSLSPDNIRFVFGRGSIGCSTEKDLAAMLQKKTVEIGKDAYKIVVAKSFGVVDTLRAFQLLGNDPEGKIGRINLLILIDGYAPFRSRKRVTFKVKIGKSKKRRFMIPEYVDKTYNIIQCKSGVKGLKAGKLGEKKVDNYVMKQSHVDSFDRVYDHYRNGYKRELIVNHRNMEEITSVIPCCLGSDEKMYTVPEIIKRRYAED